MNSGKCRAEVLCGGGRTKWASMDGGAGRGNTLHAPLGWAQPRSGVGLTTPNYTLTTLSQHLTTSNFCGFLENLGGIILAANGNYLSGKSSSKTVWGEYFGFVGIPGSKLWNNLLGNYVLGKICLGKCFLPGLKLAGRLKTGVRRMASWWPSVSELPCIVRKLPRAPNNGGWLRGRGARNRSVMTTAYLHPRIPPRITSACPRNSHLRFSPKSPACPCDLQREPHGKSSKSRNCNGRLIH